MFWFRPMNEMFLFFPHFWKKKIDFCQWWSGIFLFQVSLIENPGSGKGRSPMVEDVFFVFDFGQVRVRSGTLGQWQSHSEKGCDLINPWWSLNMFQDVFIYAIGVNDLLGHVMSCLLFLIFFRNRARSCRTCWSILRWSNGSTRKEANPDPWAGIMSTTRSNASLSGKRRKWPRISRKTGSRTWPRRSAWPSARQPSCGRGSFDEPTKVRRA